MYTYSDAIVLQNRIEKFVLFAVFVTFSTNPTGYLALIYQRSRKMRFLTGWRHYEIQVLWLTWQIWQAFLCTFIKSIFLIFSLHILSTKLLEMNLQEWFVRKSRFDKLLPVSINSWHHPWKIPLSLSPLKFLSLQHQFLKKLSNQIQWWLRINCGWAFVWEMTYPLESSNSSGSGILLIKIKIRNLELVTFRYLKLELVTFRYLKNLKFWQFF